MSDHFMRDETGRVTCVMTLANIYRYGGFTFELHYYCGPAKLTKNGDPAARQGRKFFKAIDEWLKLTDEQKEQTRFTG